MSFTKDGQQWQYFNTFLSKKNRFLRIDMKNWFSAKIYQKLQPNFKVLPNKKHAQREYKQ